MRKRVSVLLVAIAVTSLTGCAGDGDVTATPEASSTRPVDFTETPAGSVSAWAMEGIEATDRARVDEAASRLPGVDVELDTSAFDAQKFTARVASGDVPDVVQMDRRYVAEYAARAMIMPLDACFQAHDVVPDQHWYPFVVDDVRYDDQVWAVPQFYNPQAILVNETVADLAGVSDDEIDTSTPSTLLSAISRMHEGSGGDIQRLGFDPAVTVQAPLWVLGSGGQLVDATGLPTLDDPRNRVGIELLKRIAKAQGGYAAVRDFAESFDPFSAANQFSTNQVGAQVNAQWYPGVLSPHVDEIDIEAVPFRTAAGEPLSVGSGSAFVIPVGAANPAAACAWMVQVTTDEAWLAAGRAQAVAVEAAGGIDTGMFTGSPTADQAIRDRWVAPSGDADFDQVVSTYYDMVAAGRSVGSSPVGQDVQVELTKAVTAALLGQKTTRQALADAQEAAMSAYDDVTAAR